MPSYRELKAEKIRLNDKELTATFADVEYETERGKFDSIWSHCKAYEHVEAFYSFLAEWLKKKDDPAAESLSWTICETEASHVGIGDNYIVKTYLNNGVYVFLKHYFEDALEEFNKEYNS